MTAQETKTLQQVELTLERVAGSITNLSEKVDCLLEGKVAHCALQDKRLDDLETAIEKGGSKSSLQLLWKGFYVTWGVIGTVALILFQLYTNHMSTEATKNESTYQQHQSPLADHQPDRTVYPYATGKTPGAIR